MQLSELNQLTEEVRQLA